MEIIEETAETFSQVSADCKVTSASAPGEPTSQICSRMFSPWLSNIWTPAPNYTPTSGWFPSVWTTFSNHFNNCLGTLLTPKVRKMEKREENKIVILIRPQQSDWREFTSSPVGTSAGYSGTSVLDQMFSQQNDPSLANPVRTIPD